MDKESPISKLIRENKLNNVSNALGLVEAALALYEDILAFASDELAEIDRYYDEIMNLKYIGKAPGNYAKLNRNQITLLALDEKRNVLDKKLMEEQEMSNALAKITQFLKKNKLFADLGLKITSGEISGKTILINFYKLVGSKKELERRSNLYKR